MKHPNRPKNRRYQKFAEQVLKSVYACNIFIDPAFVTRIIRRIMMRFMKTYLSTYTLLASFFFGFCHSASAERAVELNDGSGQSRKLIYGSLMTAGEVIQSLKDDAIRDNKEVRKFESCQCATSVHTNLGYELQPYTCLLYTSDAADD